MRWRTAAALALILTASAATPQIHQPPAGAPFGPQEEQRLDTALRRLAPQRPGTVDAYVIAIALDSDPVFAREARAAGDVLQRRYDAVGRTIILAGSGGDSDRPSPSGSPASLVRAMARIAELMDESEDVLVLYSTSHGTPLGLTWREGDRDMASITPKQMREWLDRHGIRNRLLILSACFSGIFVPGLQTSNSVIVTAAARDRISFGCFADNDWTFFGDAMINHALRKPQSLGAAYAEATALVSEWERRFEVTPSQPQIFLGAASAHWLAPLERRMPRAADGLGRRPAVESAAALSGP